MINKQQQQPGRATWVARPGVSACRQRKPGYAWRLCAVWLLLCLGPLCLADDSAPAESVVSPALAAGDSLDALLLEQVALSPAELDGERAMAAIQVDRVVINEQELNGTVSGNTALNTISGDNAIAGDAFTGSSGFVSSVQNTGNNVLIQNATIVNIEVRP